MDNVSYWSKQLLIGMVDTTEWFRGRAARHYAFSDL